MLTPTNVEDVLCKNNEFFLLNHHHHKRAWRLNGQIRALVMDILFGVGSPPLQER